MFKFFKKYYTSTLLGCSLGGMWDSSNPKVAVITVIVSPLVMCFFLYSLKVLLNQSKDNCP